MGEEVSAYGVPPPCLMGRGAEACTGGRESRSSRWEPWSCPAACCGAPSTQQAEAQRGAQVRQRRAGGGALGGQVPRTRICGAMAPPRGHASNHNPVTAAPKPCRSRPGVVGASETTRGTPRRRLTPEVGSPGVRWACSCDDPRAGLAAACEFQTEEGRCSWSSAT